jgi:ABC-type polysaccharide/polyol phosphate export permease
MTSEISVESQKNTDGQRIVSCLLEFFKDLHEAYVYSNFSALSSYYEIKARYATSYLGPLWIVLSNVIFIGFISVLYSSIFNMPLDEYIPYLATGYLLWTLMVSVFLEGGATFLSYGQMLKDYKISPLVIYCRVFLRAVIVLAHNLPVIFAVVFYFKGFVFDLPLFFLGMLINLSCIFFMGLANAILSCRFRDIYYVMPSIFQVLILLTPILWKADMLVGRKAILLDVNLLYQLLELVRAPLLGGAAPGYFYVNCTILLVISFIVTAFLYVRSKNKIVFWT